MDRRTFIGGAVSLPAARVLAILPVLGVPVLEKWCRRHRALAARLIKRDAMRWVSDDRTAVQPA